MKGLLTLAGLAIGMFMAASCGDGEREFDATGTFEATEVVVSSEASGRIISLDIREGASVVEGGEYGLVDTVQLSLKKAQLCAGINAALSKVQSLDTQTAPVKEQISALEKEKDRVTRLIAANAANTKQLDDVNNSIAVLKKQLAALENSVLQANDVIDAEIVSLRTQISQIDDLLSKCRIISPLKGVVLAKYSEQGELTSMGKPIFKVADVDNMYLRAYITAGQLTELKLGQQVKVLADSGDKGRREYEGTVAWISDKAEFTPKTIQTRDERANLVYAVKIAFRNDGYVKIGMYGDVRF